MNEYETIRRIAACFRSRSAPVNRPFVSDAEFVRIGSALWGMTMDEFSPSEDLFTANDPRVLGANLATATLSDLLAAGVEPQCFMHALCLPRDPDIRFVETLCGGMADVLDRADCTLCGGDLGTAEPWRYTGFAMGPLGAPRPITRQLAARPQTLWITGTLGDLNMAAFTGAATPEIELRLHEAQQVQDSALAGIDTSGGLADALWMLHQASPGMRLCVDAAALPYAPGVRETCAAAGIPPESALFGGAGEYELLFALPGDTTTPARFATLREAGLTPIGQAVPSAHAGVYFRLASGIEARMAGPPPCPRQACNTQEHARQAAAAAVTLLNSK